MIIFPLSFHHPLMLRKEPLFKILFQFGWFWLALLCVFLCLTTSVYLTFRDDINFLLAKPYELVHNHIWRTVFYVHITSGMVCILTGPFQFIPTFRKKFVAFHRNLGKAYVLSILAFAAPTGMYMAFFANGGFWSGAGFLMLSFFWWISTYKAYRYIRQGNVAKHRQFMVYSFALTFSAVTLRLWVPLLSQVFDLDHQLTVVITAWINWIPNLILAHFFVNYFPNRI